MTITTEIANEPTTAENGVEITTDPSTTATAMPTEELRDDDDAPLKSSTAIPMGAATTDEEKPKVVEAVSVVTTTTTSTENSEPSKKKTSPLAIVSLILALVGFFFFGFIIGPFALIIGLIARRNIKRNPEEYQGMCQAMLGAILGLLETIWGVIVIAVVVSQS